MEALKIAAALLILVAIIVVVRRAGKRGRAGGVGTGAAGAVYGLLNEDRRKAIEIIVEDRAAARDPEDAEGNLPDLAGPVKK